MHASAGSMSNAAAKNTLRRRNPPTPAAADAAPPTKPSFAGAAAAAPAESAAQRAARLRGSADRVAHALTVLPGLCLACWCYANSLGNELVYDDLHAIATNADVRPEAPLAALLQHDFWGMPITNELSNKVLNDPCCAFQK